MLVSVFMPWLRSLLGCWGAFPSFACDRPENSRTGLFRLEAFSVNPGALVQRSPDSAHAVAPQYGVRRRESASAELGQGAGI